MAVLPVNEDLVAAAIYATYERRASERRPHLGASLIGSHCTRAVWYTFRWASPPRFAGRVLRLFETGKREEGRVVIDLRNAGMVVHDVDPTTRRQFRFTDHGGHFSGSLDGCALNVPAAEKTWHVLEIKTHNAKSFAELKAKHVQVAKAQHLAQMMCYCGWSGMTRALYVAICKDTDEIYTERVAFMPRLFEEARTAALEIILATEPPKRSESDLCVFCEHREVCLCGAFPDVTCRTCLHLIPDVTGTDGRWVCKRDQRHLTTALQERGCDNRLFIPALVATGEAVELGDDFVIYQAHDGVSYFANGGAAGFPAISGPSYRSAEMGKRVAP